MSRKFYVSEAKVVSFEAVISVFGELFKELKDLGKKKPETTLSASKVRIINRLLEDVLKCLDGEPERKYLELLDDDAVPQYSDAILILSQYEGALRAFKERYYGYNSELHRDQWFIKGKT